MIQKGLFAGSPPFTLLLMLVFTMLTSFLFFMLTGIALAPVIFDIPFYDFYDQISDTGSARQLNVMRYLQVVFSISIFIIPAFIAAYLFSGNAIAYLGLRRSVHSKWFAATLILVFAAMPFVNLLLAFNEMIVFPESLAGFEQWLINYERSAHETTNLFLKTETAVGLLFNIFMIALLPAIGEELIFRGLLHKIFAEWTKNIHVTIIVTGFLFSLMHIQFYGFFPRWALGVMFGYLFVWSGTIWLPIFAHFVNNAVAVTMFHLINRGAVSENFENFGSYPTDIPITIATTLVCAIILLVMYHKRRENLVNKIHSCTCTET